MGDIEYIDLDGNDFAVFKQECTKWIRTLGLNGWRVIYRHNDLDGTLAEKTSNLVGRIAVITLNKKWSKDEYTAYNIRRTAFHEILELFLSRMVALAEYRHTAKDEIEEETHNIIRTLENMVFKGE